MTLAKLKNRRGSALLIALCLIMMLTLVAIVAVDNSNTDIELSMNAIASSRAFYVAEAGAKQAFVALKGDPGWRAGYNDVSFGGGVFAVAIVDSSTNAALRDTVLVRSRGEVMEGTSEVELTLAPEKIHPFKYAMFAKDLVDIRNSMTTDSYNSDSGSYAATAENLHGDVGSNGDIVVHNGAVIGGDVSTSLAGGLSVHPGASVAGDTTSTAPPIDLPDIPQSDFDAAAISNDNLTGMSGSYSYDPVSNELISSGTVTLTSGTYYFSDMTLKNSAQLLLAPGANVTIYITGDIEIKNSAAVNTTGDPGDMLILSQGDMYLKNSGDIKAAFYAPDGSADLRNSGEFYGSIVANDIIAHNSAEFHYDRQLGNIEFGGSGEMHIVGWRQL